MERTYKTVLISTNCKEKNQEQEPPSKIAEGFTSSSLFVLYTLLSNPLKYKTERSSLIIHITIYTKLWNTCILAVACCLSEGTMQTVAEPTGRIHKVRHTFQNRSSIVGLHICLPMATRSNLLSSQVTIYLTNSQSNKRQQNMSLNHTGSEVNCKLTNFAKEQRYYTTHFTLFI